MLAQNFKSADELEITEAQVDALRKTLVLLETGKLVHASLDVDFDRSGFGVFSGEFNMGSFGFAHKCGTVACIAGTAEIISGVKFVCQDRPVALSDLFFAYVLSSDMEDITPSQAAIALRSYLTTGDARWDLAVA